MSHRYAHAHADTRTNAHTHIHTRTCADRILSQPTKAPLSSDGLDAQITVRLRGTCGGSSRLDAVERLWQQSGESPVIYLRTSWRHTHAKRVGTPGLNAYCGFGQERPKQGCSDEADTHSRVFTTYRGSTNQMMFVFGLVFENGSADFPPCNFPILRAKAAEQAISLYFE